MGDEKHKPLFFDTIKWVILLSIAISIIWLIFAFVYSDTYAKNKELRIKQEASEKGRRTKFREEKTDPMAGMDSKKLAGYIRAFCIVGVIVQILFLYGIYSNNRYLSTAFIIWAFLLAILAFKMALKEHLFWIQAGWCLGVGLVTTQYVHNLYQVS